VHLESLNFAPQRKYQIKECAKELERYERSSDTMLMGDFNFCSYRNFDKYSKPLENDNLKNHIPQYVDLWAQIHPERKGYTFDSERNPIIIKFERMRYDRIMHKSQSFKAKDIFLYGTHTVKLSSKKPEKLKGEGIPHSLLLPDTIPLSDHFGLAAFFVPSKI